MGISATIKRYMCFVAMVSEDTKMNAKRLTYVFSYFVRDVSEGSSPE